MLENKRRVTGSFGLLAALTLFAALLSGGQAAADVHAMASIQVPGTPNYASSNGTWVEVCDMEQDGNRVYGVFDTDTGTQRIYDSSGGGCGNATFGKVYRFKVCEDQPVSADPCSGIVTP
ncbi:hypothetical protein [Lentzea sp. NPDC059081]|uniref:hypothetical protein n=1 Tax=Lentzea sp. NPDC059081 TaxID=3346719 RepID=UPI0036A6AD6E